MKQKIINLLADLLADQIGSEVTINEVYRVDIANDRLHGAVYGHSSSLRNSEVRHGQNK